MPTTTYNSLQTGNVLIERGSNGDVTITQNNIGITVTAADFDAITSGYPGLKSATPPTR